MEYTGAFYTAHTRTVSELSNALAEWQVYELQNNTRPLAS